MSQWLVVNSNQKKKKKMSVGQKFSIDNARMSFKITPMGPISFLYVFRM